MDKILVTIICTTFNQERYIRKALDGFLMQKTNFLYEVIVHDDASTDRTPSIIREYAEKYPHVIVPILQKENQFSKGVWITNDLLLPMAKGKYIAMCEGDDFWTDPNKLQMQADIMEKYPECSVCVHSVRGISENEKKVIRTFPKRKMESGVISAAAVMNRMLAKGEWLFHTTSYFFKKSDALEMGEKKYEFWTKSPYGDFAYMLMAALKGNFYYINKEMSVYRMGAIGSTVRRDMNLGRRKQRDICFIETVENFDELTNHRFHEDVVEAVRRYRFEIADVEKNYNVLLAPEMKNNWKKLPLYVRTRIRVSKIFPGFDKFYYRLRKLIKGV